MTAPPPGLDVLCFGEVLIDFFPEPAGRSLVEAQRFVPCLGGAPANVAVALGRLGLRAGLLTLVGRDGFGALCRRRLVEAGVDVSALGIHPRHKTGITFVSAAPDGGRAFLFFRNPSADQCVADSDVDPARVAAARALHFGSSTLCREPAAAATRKALDAAAAAGATVSFDPNLRPHLWERPEEAAAEVRALLPRCHLLKVADDELAPLCGTDDPVEGARALRALGARLVVVTAGARGCWFDGPMGRGAVPARPAVAVDATGAGDAFVAGLLWRLVPLLGAGRTVADLALGEVRAACEAGAEYGARAVTAVGATTWIAPTATSEG